MDVNITYFNYPKDLVLGEDELRAERDRLERLYYKIERHRECTFHTVDEDDTLPDDVLDAIDRADTRFCKMLDYCEEAIECIDESIKALHTLENNIPFVYEECAEFLKKGAWK